MMKPLYNLITRDAMKKRAYLMLISRDNGTTFTTYESAGDFEKKTGHSVSTRFRAEVIEVNGGISLAVGESTPPVKRIMQGVPFVVVFKRKK